MRKTVPTDYGLVWLKPETVALYEPGPYPKRHVHKNRLFVDGRLHRLAVVMAEHAWRKGEVLREI